MALHNVHTEHTIATSAASVWAVVGDFCAKWHPWLAWVKPEDGGRVRHFSVKGEQGSYREELLVRDPTQHVLKYRHIEGIRDVSHYTAEMRLVLNGDSCVVVWSAEFSAPDPRASEIAAGTRAIFETGMRHLAALLESRNVQIPSPQGTIGITVRGQIDTPLVLFLHGIGGNRSNWVKQIAASAPNCLAVAMDFRGYGTSSLGIQQSCVDDYCADILTVLDYFHAEDVVLVGLSLGAWVATSFAMRHGHKLRGLVLAGGCTGMSEAPVEERSRFMRLRQEPLDKGLTPKDFAPKVVEMIAGPQADDDVRAELLNSMAGIPAETYRDAVNCFANPAEVFDFLRIACPVLLLTGEHDTLASPQEIDGVAARMRNAGATAQFKLIRHAGHVCNLEQPTEFNRALLEFLDHAR